MHKKNFIVWYYSDGLKNAFQSVRNLLKFIPHFFSMRLLSQTLFSLWRKNSLIKNWEGFDFFLSAKNFLESFWRRFFGFLIRFSVLILGGLVFLLTLILSLFFLVFYFSFPAFLALGIAMCFSDLIYFGVILLFILAVFIVNIYIQFDTFDHYLYQKMSVYELSKLKWFYRIYERLGVKKEEVPTEILTDFDEFKKFIATKNVSVEECEKIVSWEIEQQIKREKAKSFFSTEKLEKILPIGLYWNFGKTNYADNFTDDLIQEKNSRSEFPFVGYVEEMKLLEEIISRNSENNVLIAGPVGSGRRMLVYQLAEKIKTGKYNQSNRILQFNFEQLNKQIKNLKDGEEFLEDFFEEIILAGNVILVIDDFEKCLAMKVQDWAFSDFIEKFAQFPSFRIIGIADEKSFGEKFRTGYKNRSCELENVLQNFEVVYVSEMSDEETMQVLFDYFYGEKHTPFTFQSLRQIIANSPKIYKNLPLPTRAIKLAQEVFNFWKKLNSQDFITAELVNIFTSKKNQSENYLISRKEKEVFSLENNFYQKLVGQDLAINSLSGAIRKMRNETGNLEKNCHSFLFFGPMGTGKTEMAKVFSEQYFGKENVIEIEVSNFLENTEEKLLGSKIRGEQGIFAQLKNAKNSVVLFKDLERANSQFLTIFSAVLKNCLVKDNFDQKIEFQNLVFIANFNADFLFMKNLVEKNLGLIKMKELIFSRFSQRTIFTADFFAKFDEMILFFPLKTEEIYQLAEVLLNKFSVNFQKEKQVEVYFAEKVVEKIIKNGFDENLGARSLFNYIEVEILNFLKNKIIQENIQRGSCIYFTEKDMRN